MTKRFKNANATLFFSLASGSVGTSQRGQAVVAEDEDYLLRSGRVVHRFHSQRAVKVSKGREYWFGAWEVRLRTGGVSCSPQCKVGNLAAQMVHGIPTLMLSISQLNGY